MKMVKITYFKKGTIVKCDGIPCELLSDVPYYSATFGSDVDKMDLYYRFMWMFRRLFGKPLELDLDQQLSKGE